MDSNLDESMAILAARMVDSRIRQWAAWYNSPAMIRQREESEKRWLAKSWYERAMIRTRSKVNRWRERLGEIIAGREFDGG